MKLISWNVRGLRNSGAKNAVRQLLDKEKPDVLFVFETKLSRNDFERFCMSCGYPNVLAHSSNGASDGVGLCWNNQVTLDLITIGFYSIDVTVLNDGDGRSWRLTGFYGHPNPASRHESWDLIRSLRTQSTLPWVCIGDFNELLWSYEKKGGPARNANQMQMFRQAADDCNLIDLGYSGPWFTWERGGVNSPLIRERLDRAFATPDWWELISDFSLRHLVNAHSDHNPIMLATGAANAVLPPATSPPKRFCASWTLDDECENLVRTLWTESTGSVVDKIPIVLNALLRWSSIKFGGRKKRKRKLQKKLERLSLLEPTDDIIHEMVEVKTAINTEINQEEALWAHHAHINWLFQGDRNTSVFHKSASQRKRTNTIRSLERIPGDAETSTDGIEPKVDEQMNMQLARPYTKEDVRAALFSMGPNKASGPDGMPALFYQKYWSIVGADVSSFCLEFLNGDASIERINGSNVVLILKITNPERMQHFRPISLSNVLYKIIAKTLANRFKGILDVCIDPAQSAFLPGRLISDNVIIAYEMLHTLKNKRDGGDGLFALKMDMSKAYDRVEWPYLEAVMRKMGFHETFVSLIMHCVRTVSYSVLMNGGVSDTFHPSHGIRQGDPLSTYLFLICCEGLSSLLRQAQANGLITGLQASNNGPAVTHLLFADDAILFGKASLQGTLYLRDLIYLYGWCSGQQVNYDKSLIYFSSNASVTMRNMVKHVLRVRVENNPERYLGLPSMVGRNRTLSFQYLKDNLGSRTKSWTTRFLSLAGKEVFIKAVLQSLPTYAMNCFLLPRGLCNGMNGIISKYWWRGSDDSSGMCWARWSLMCAPKARGGLGFRDLGSFNVAMLAKQGWRLLANPSSLAAQVLKAKYYPRTSFLDADVGSAPSFTWRSIWAARGLLEKGICWRVGNGLAIRAWQDPWVPELPLEKLRPLSGRVNPSQRVTDFINLHSMQWDVEYLQEMMFPADVVRVLRIPLPDHPVDDVVAWQFENTGIYSVRSGYQVLTGNHRLQGEGNHSPLSVQHIQFYKKLWTLKLPPKVLHLVWKVFKNYISTRRNLFDRHIAQSSVCPRCNVADESSLHTFRDCVSFANVWSMLGIQWNDDNQQLHVQEWLMQIINSHDTRKVHIIFLTIWANWTNRNKFVHEGHITSPTQLFQFVMTYFMELENGQPPVSRVPQASSRPRWMPPPSDELKVNFDAFFDASRESSYSGIVIRNFLGELMSAGSIQTSLINSACAAKAVACLQAVKLAAAMGYRKLVFESDSQVVIKAMVSFEINRSPITPFITSAQHVLSKFESCRFEFKRRDVNACALTLAKFRMNVEEDRFWTDDSPEVLADLLQSDRSPN